MGSGVQNNIGFSLKAGNSAKGSIGDTRQQATKAVQDHLTSLIAASRVRRRVVVRWTVEPCSRRSTNAPP